MQVELLTILKSIDKMLGKALAEDGASVVNVENAKDVLTELIKQVEKAQIIIPPPLPVSDSYCSCENKVVVEGETKCQTCGKEINFRAEVL